MMQQNPILSCLLASLILSTSIPVSIEAGAQSLRSSHTGPTQSPQGLLFPENSEVLSLATGPGQALFKGGPTNLLGRSTGSPITMQRTGGYCGQHSKPITALVPTQGISFTTEAGANLWVALPPTIASQDRQKFRLTVSPLNGTSEFAQNYLVATTPEGLAKISIPPQAFSQSAKARADYKWTLTYACPENTSTVPMTGVIGVQPQAMAKTLKYSDRIQFFGKNGHWFDLLEALISPPQGVQGITAPSLRKLLELDAVRLSNFYPELAALILNQEEESEQTDLGLQLESLTNSSRLNQNLSQLKSSSALNKAAQDYANLMAKNNCSLIHNCGGIGLSDRLKGQNIPTKFRAENLVKVPKELPNPGKTAFDTLQNSWPHRRNIHIPEWLEAGVGVAETPDDYYFVQIFNQPQKLPSFESQQDVILPPNSPTPRVDFEKALFNYSVEEGISLIEGKGLRDFAQSLGPSFIKTSNSPSASKIASDLRDPAQGAQKKAGIIYVVATEKTLLLYLLVPQDNGQPTIIRKTVPVSRLKVLGTAQQFWLRVINPTHETDFLPYATQLHHWLIDPLQDSLEELEIDTLLFTLDDGLRSIPMAALHNGQDYLIERYSMALLPTFGLTESGGFKMDEQKILAMGITQSHGGLSALPSVKTEVEEISKLFHPNQSKVTLNEDTTVEQLTTLSRSQKYGIIHLATHARFQPQKSGESFLQFWNQRLNLEGLGSLGRQLNWDKTPTVEMLVMSACTTAMGDRNSELGFAGSAVLAGVKSTVASLWNVNDISSTAFMIDFYRNLEQSSTKTEAFRQTQIAMLDGKLRIESGNIIFPNQTRVKLPGSTIAELSLPLSHPYYWAGHTVIGNWN